jgi:hypothetical protein
MERNLFEMPAAIVALLLETGLRRRVPGASLVLRKNPFY